MNQAIDKPSKAKRVMLCTPVLLLGGTEIQMLTLVRTLITGGYKVGTCCYYEFARPMVDQFKEAGAQVFLLKLDRSSGCVGVKKSVELIRKLVRCFEEFEPDIVHVQYLAPGLIPVIAARLSGIGNIFATVHIAGSIAYGMKAKLLLRIASKMTTLFICVSQGVEKFWFGDSHLFQTGKPLKNRKHFTIYNAIDVSRIAEITHGLDRNELRNCLGIKDQLVLGSVGRLAHQKGQTILLDAFAEVVKNFPSTMLFIIGDGPDKAELREKAKRLGLDMRIRWFGALPQEEVFRLYPTMDVFVMPSLYEGFGLAAAEAMAAGLPVAGTRIEGLTEVIEDGLTGFLVPPADEHALAERITYLLNNRDTAAAIGKRGAERVRSLFSLEEFSERIISAYECFPTKQDP